MDYLKLLAVAFSPAIACYAILVSYKKKRRDGDPNSEREVLTFAGKVALVLVVIAGGVSFGSELRTQQRAQQARDSEAREVIEQLRRIELKQDEATRALLQRMEELSRSRTVTVEATPTSITSAAPAAGLSR